MKILNPSTTSASSSSTAISTSNTTNDRSNNDNSNALYHLYYEIEMLCKLKNILFINKIKYCETIDNSLIESLAIHIRNLIDFLYLKQPGRDDITAVEFSSDKENLRKILGEDPPAILSHAKIKANKQVNHLTKERFINGPEKEWSIDIVNTIIQKLLDILENNALDKIPMAFQEKLISFIRKHNE